MSLKIEDVGDLHHITVVASVDSSSSDDFSEEENDFAIQILKGLDDNSSVKSDSSVSLTDSTRPDLRNTITKSFEDCLNSGDPDFVNHVLTPILDECCVVESYRLKQIGIIGNEELEATVSGKDKVIPYFMGYVVAIPDVIFLIHEWKLFNRGGGNSCLMFKFTMSGNQIVAHDNKCKIEEEVGAEENIAGKKRSQPDNSVKFKATTHQGRYDKNKKQKTLGEFITHNRVYNQHVAEVETLIQDVAEENVPEEIQLVACPGVEKVENTTAAQTSGLQAAIKINMRGVMRFHFNEKNQIYKIHCVHFTTH